jgi:hypothetical protein
VPSIFIDFDHLEEELAEELVSESKLITCCYLFALLLYYCVDLKA